MKPRKRKTKFSPTSRTMKELRLRGYPCAVTEKWVKFGPVGGVRVDCFGGDILALAGDATINIQAGVGSSHAAKITKAKSIPEVRQWLASGSRWFWIWTWSMRVAYKQDGTKRKDGRWAPRITVLKLEGGEFVESEFFLAPVKEVKDGL